MLGYLRGTATSTGLAVRAYRDEGVYVKGEAASDAEMASLNLERHAVCPTWNYTIRPRPDHPPSALAIPPMPEVIL
jgi:hypothetical protein